MDKHSIDFINETFLKHFNNFAENAFNTFLKSNSKDELFYHYTSLQSLQKIIETESLRATSIYMLNDPNELVHGYQNVSNWFMPDISDKLSNGIHAKTFCNFPAFIFSLTELDDDMHQWEKYGNKHKGIRIGFKPEKLLEYWRKLENITVLIVPIIYQNIESDFDYKFKDDFVSFKNAFRKDINQHFYEIKITQNDYLELSYCTAVIASMIKRSEWSSENEWRIICIPQGYVHESIIGDFSTGEAVARLENKTIDTLTLLTQRGHGGAASRDILKVGCNAGNIEHIEYNIQLLMKKQTGVNFFNDRITQSEIVTR